MHASIRYNPPWKRFQCVDDDVAGGTIWYGFSDPGIVIHIVKPERMICSYGRIVIVIGCVSRDRVSLIGCIRTGRIC